MWPFRRPARFSFRPEWKEQLVVTGPGGTFTLVFWMGVPTVEMPAQDRWIEIAPAWARPLWPELKRDLEAWCRENDVALQVSATARLY